MRILSIVFTTIFFLNVPAISQDKLIKKEKEQIQETLYMFLSDDPEEFAGITGFREEFENSFLKTKKEQYEGFIEAYKKAKTFKDKVILQQQSLKREKELYNKFILYPNLNAIEHTVLLRMGATIDRREGRYVDATKKLLTILNYNVLPNTRKVWILHELYEMDYSIGKFDIAAKAFLEYSKLSDIPIQPWVRASLAEVFIKSNRNDLALKQMQDAINHMTLYGCPVEKKWSDVLLALENSDEKIIEKIKNNVAAFMYTPVAFKNLAPEKIWPHKYPDKVRRNISTRVRNLSVTIHLGLVVDEQGKTICSFLIGPVIGHTAFLSESKDAVLKYKYEPLQENQAGWRYGIEAFLAY